MAVKIITIGRNKTVEHTSHRDAQFFSSYKATICGVIALVNIAGSICVPSCYVCNLAQPEALAAVRMFGIVAVANIVIIAAAAGCRQCPNEKNAPYMLHAVNICSSGILSATKLIPAPIHKYQNVTSVIFPAPFRKMTPKVYICTTTK